MTTLRSLALCTGLVAAGGSVAGAQAVVHYGLNETGGTLVDDVGGVNMTPQDPAAFTYGVPSVTPGTYGAITVTPGDAAAFGTAVSSNGTSVALNNTANNALNTLAAPMTVMAWVNQSTTAGRQRLLSGSFGDGNGWGYGLDGGTQIFTTYAVADYGPIGTGTAQPNTWQHVAVTFTGTQTDFYLNGTFLESRTGGNLNPNTSEAFALFGTSNPAELFSGALDEVEVFNRVLSAGEIIAEAVPVPEPATAAVLALGGLALLARRRRV